MSSDEFTNWPEIACFLTLLLGLLFALTVDSLLIRFIVLFIVSMAFGRVCYLFGGYNKYHIYLIVVGFLIGFVLGMREHIKAVLILFLGGFILSYGIHRKGWMDWF